MKGGLSEGHAPIHPLDMEDIKELEVRARLSGVESQRRFMRLGGVTTVTIDAVKFAGQEVPMSVSTPASHGGCLRVCLLV